MTSVRTVRMIESSPDYYEESAVFEGIQDAVAQDYDLQEVSDADLQNQLYATTATWGLRYWEGGLGIPVKESDSYEERRGRVIAKLIGEGNFSAKLLHSLAQGYGQTIRVAINPAAFLVTVTFMQGIPPFLEAYQDAVENLVHAHLGVEYKFEYYVNFGASITSDYARYVYDIPFTAAFLTGTYPSIAVLGQQYASSLPISSEELTVSQDLDYCGTQPFVAVDGWQYTSALEISPEVIPVVQDMQVASELFYGGTYPYVVTGGMQYVSASNMTTEELTVAQDLPYSGTLPYVAVDGRQVDSGISAGTEETAVEQSLVYCNTVYSGGVTI